MNKATRIALAQEIVKIASDNGATRTQVEHEGRSTHVECHFADVSVSVDLDIWLDGGILAHWYGAKRDLQCVPGFDSVNPCHKRKATMYGLNDTVFLHKFGHACRAVASGQAFACP